MKKLFIILVLVCIVWSGICFGANGLVSVDNATDGYEVASVDTDPGTAGFGTGIICLRKKLGTDADKMTFDIETIGTGATITLQKSYDGVTFVTYEDYTAVETVVIEDIFLYWQAIVADNNQGSSGTSKFSLFWK